ncbi:CLUMA_CG011698, isoform A [Clunio marinus]|uniref:CLUMA_CG011698, isoform A n=1 Tax=Clunio marinus TaxID=568069 RepID=A0A1J1IDP3_9DIPT|nr:CLUMA_CG011698, isoform A [Clunio marinus]
MISANNDYNCTTLLSKRLFKAVDLESQKKTLTELKTLLTSGDDKGKKKFNVTKALKSPCYCPVLRFVERRMKESIF